MTYNHHGRKANEDDLRMLPEEILGKIVSLANSNEYIHGFECGCKNRSNCYRNFGRPYFEKIAETLEISTLTIRSYLDKSYREHRRELAKRYLHTKNGATKRFEYEHSPEGLAAKDRYENTEKGRKATEKSKKKFKLKSRNGAGREI